jgi:hypothetical protein
MDKVLTDKIEVEKSTIIVNATKTPLSAIFFDFIKASPL